MYLKHSFHSWTCQVADLEMSALHHHGLYIYDCCRLPVGNMPLKWWLMNFRVAQRLKHPLYRISKNSTSLFVHYCKGDVLEDFLGLVDFTVKLNVNDKQRGALRKLQHFVVNRMSRDIISAAVCIHPSLEWCLGLEASTRFFYVLHFLFDHFMPIFTVFDFFCPSYN